MVTRRRLLEGGAIGAAASLSGCLETLVPAGFGGRSSGDRGSEKPDNGGGQTDSPAHSATDIEVRALSESDLQARGVSDSNVEGGNPLSWLDGWNLDAASASPAEVIQIGRGDDQHWVVVLTDAEEPRETRVAVRTAMGTRVYGATLSLSRSAYAAIRFELPGRYRIDLGDRFGGTGVDVDEDRIDCNLSVQGVRLRSSGDVDEKIVSTRMGCQSSMPRS